MAIVRSITTFVLKQRPFHSGDPGVGKTALTQMFYSAGTTYPKNYVLTSNVEFSVKTVNIPETTAQVELYLMDTPGQNIFNQLGIGMKHWEGASMVMVVYDISSRESFQGCAKWLKKAQDTRPGRRIPGVLVANKVDLRGSSRAVVATTEGQALAKASGLEYFETSAEEGKDVDAPYNCIADAFYKQYLTHIQQAADQML